MAYISFKLPWAVKVLYGCVKFSRQGETLVGKLRFVFRRFMSFSRLWRLLQLQRSMPAFVSLCAVKGHGGAAVASTSLAQSLQGELVGM